MLAQNPFMITKEFTDESFVSWLEKDCALPDLASELRTLFHRGCQLGEYISRIVSYAGYNTEEEMALIDEALVHNANLSEYERQMSQGDFLLKNGHIEGALKEYELILNDIPAGDTALKSALFKKMGYAYALLFMFDVSARYYRRSYELDGNAGAGLKYLASLRMYYPEDKYLGFLSEHPELKESSLILEGLTDRALSEFESSEENLRLNALSVYKDEGNEDSYYEEIDKCIASLKEAYLEMVAG